MKKMINTSKGLFNLDSNSFCEERKINAEDFDPSGPTPIDAIKNLTTSHNTLLKTISRGLAPLTKSHLLVIYGTGSNGKTTFIDKLRRMFSEYWIIISDFDEINGLEHDKYRFIVLTEYDYNNSMFQRIFDYPAIYILVTNLQKHTVYGNLITFNKIFTRIPSNNSSKDRHALATSEAIKQYDNLLKLLIEYYNSQ